MARNATYTTSPLGLAAPAGSAGGVHVEETTAGGAR